MEKIFLKSKEYAGEEKVKPTFVQPCKKMSRGLSAEQVLKNDMFHIKLPFPWKLHELLHDVERDSNEHIISWLLCGSAFKIHKPDEFCDSIMTKYFRQTKFKSFTRQLYIYGFSKIEGGHADGAFSHPEFVKGNRSLCLILGRNQLGDRRLKKARKQTVTPTTEESKPRSAHLVTPNMGGRTNSARESLKESGNFPAFAVDSTAIQERLFKTGRAAPNSTTLNPGLEGPGDLVARSEFFMVGDGASRPVYADGNRTTLPEETSIFDWMNTLEKKFPLQSSTGQPSLGVMSMDLLFGNDFEPRPIEKMNEHP